MNQQSPGQCFVQLNALMAKQIVKIEDLNGYLDNLKITIANGNFDQLDHLVSKQSLPVEEIDDLEHQRTRLLGQFGFGANRDGLHKCIQWCDQDDVLKNTYTRFEQSLQQLQHAVQLNHLIVSKSRNRIRQSLHLLTRQAPAGENTTYSACGVTETSPSKRSIAQV